MTITIRALFCGGRTSGIVEITEQLYPAKFKKEASSGKSGEDADPGAELLRQSIADSRGTRFGKPSCFIERKPVIEAVIAESPVVLFFCFDVHNSATLDHLNAFLASYKTAELSIQTLYLLGINKTDEQPATPIDHLKFRELLRTHNVNASFTQTGLDEAYITLGGIFMRIRTAVCAQNTAANSSTASTLFLQYGANALSALGSGLAVVGEVTMNVLAAVGESVAISEAEVLRMQAHEAAVRARHMLEDQAAASGTRTTAVPRAPVYGYGATATTERTTTRPRS